MNAATNLSCRHEFEIKMKECNSIKQITLISIKLKTANHVIPGYAWIYETTKN